MQNLLERPTSSVAGLYTLALRWVIGWTYFSAFWRRLVLDNKLIPEEAGYIGEKFNHFLPNALGIKPMIEYLVSNPEALYVAMLLFTLIEAVVGLCLILGFFTRLMSIGVMLLACGILLGSGWLGTTCLDEWQIGVLGIAGGFTIFLTGGGSFTIDAYFIRKSYAFSYSKWFSFMGSGILPIKKLSVFVLVVSVLIAGLTLYTNQYFHGGVYGTLHNKSVRPHVELAHVQRTGKDLRFQLFRTEGADVYGSFLIGIQILNAKQELVKHIGQTELANFPLAQIDNHYVAKIKPGKHSLILPLGAKADLTIRLDDQLIGEGYSLKLIDISGLAWLAEIK